MKKAWSNIEEDQLINCYKKRMSIPEIVNILSRSPKSVESKIWMFKQTNRLEK